MDDFVLNVKQILQYPPKNLIGPTDSLLFQSQLGGPYGSIFAADLVSSALASGGWLLLATHFGINWGDRGTFWYDPGSFQFSDLVTAPSFNATAGGLFDNGKRVATEEMLQFLVANQVLSVNGRTGHVQIETDDIMRAGAAPISSPHFDGWVTAPTVWDLRRNDDTVATTAWVQQLLLSQITGLLSGQIVTTFNGRSGDVVLTTADINAAYAAAVAPDWPTAPSPALGDASNRVATTRFVDDTLADFQESISTLIEQAAQASLAAYAPLASPAFSGVPTAPTAAPGSSTGQLATTAYVQAALTAATAGVSSFNTRVGAVVLLAADVTGVGGALLASPTFSGVPAAPTAAPGANTTQLATTAFVHAAVAAISVGVTTFNTRSGAVVLTTADITGAGGATLASPALTGAPTAPTATAGTSTTQLATTAFVAAALATVAGGVTSWNGRTGAVSLQANDISAAGGALLAGPNFSGVPSAPTAAPGTSTTQLATCAFVAASVAAGNVTSFNGRTGAVTLATGDITGAGGAPISSPNFTGVPTATTASQTSNDTTLATTAFVHSAVGVSGGVTSFNTRTGAVTLINTDVTAAGGALLASPTFTGTPAAPTAALNTNTTQLANTAFVQAAVNASVVTFNGRTGAVTLQANDVSGVGGALLASPTFTGNPAAPTQTTGTNNTTLATTAFVQAAISAGGGVLTFNTRAGAVTFLAADLTGVGGALLAGPAFTGNPTAPTQLATDNSTKLATTAYVTAAVGASVTSFNTRTGAVTLATADITGAGGALLASPTFTGTPAAPTATAGTATTQLATTAFVTSAVNGTVLSFNARTGAVTLASSDITNAGGAMLASPVFTGAPAAPTAGPGTNTTQLATTAFVMAAVGAAGGVTTFNTRSGAVVLTAADVTGVGGALLAGPAFTGTPTTPTAAAHTNNTQVASTAYVDAAVAGVGGTPIRYFAGTVNPTLLGVTVSSNPTAGVVTWSGAHGIAVGNVFCGAITATVPSGLAANTPYYFRSLSATTMAMYNTLSDAKADTNRITGVGAGTTGWNVRQFLYQGFIQSGFDAQVPIGGMAATGNMRLELNLATALAGLFALVIVSHVSGLFDSGATPAGRNNWITGTSPTIVSTTLARFDTGSWIIFAPGGGTANAGQGAWSSQGTNPFYVEFVVIG